MNSAFVKPEALDQSLTHRKCEKQIMLCNAQPFSLTLSRKKDSNGY
jgi:hypothetical protein